MRRRARTDRNHAEIRAIFRALCPACEDTSDVGRGFPDLVILTAKGSVYMTEIKDGTKPPSGRKLTEHEERFAGRWGSAYQIVTTVEEAIALAKR